MSSERLHPVRVNGYATLSEKECSILRLFNLIESQAVESQIRYRRMKVRLGESRLLIPTEESMDAAIALRKLKLVSFRSIPKSKVVLNPKVSRRGREAVLSCPRGDARRVPLEELFEDE